MKDTTRPVRHGIFASLWNALNEKERSSGKPNSTKNLPARAPRREFVYYQPVIDYETQQIAGHLTDISAGGFRLDCKTPFPIDKDFRFIIKLSMEVADKPAMIFTARSKWCKVDALDPYLYNVGFQLIQISPEDLKIFQRMMEKYGRDHTSKPEDVRSHSKR